MTAKFIIRMKALIITGFLISLGYISISQDTSAVVLQDTNYYFTDPVFELLKAADDGDTIKIKAFLEIGTDVNASTWDGVTPLMYAAQAGHLRAVEILLHAGANVNTKPLNQIDALLGACIAGHVFVADTLILNRADINTRNINGITPLMYAAAFNYDVLAEVLLFYGAKVDATDNFGNQAIHFSTFYNNLEITRMLVQHGASFEAADLDGFSPLMIASQNGHTSHGEYLISLGADIDKINRYGLNALSLALIDRNNAIARLLIDAGADVDFQISKKVNQHSLARLYGDPSSLLLLEEKGAKPSPGLWLDEMAITFLMNGTRKDFMIGPELSLLETKSGLEASFGYLTRPAVRSVLYETGPNEYVQYWESRSLLNLGLNKNVRLARFGFNQAVLAFGGLQAGYTWGKFRGSNQKPDDQFLPIPKAGFSYKNGAFRFTLSYEYMNLNQSKASPHRVNFGVGLNIRLSKVTIKTKQEPEI